MQCKHLLMNVIHTFMYLFMFGVVQWEILLPSQWESEGQFSSTLHTESPPNTTFVSDQQKL